jgi:hypothetical protein
MYIVRVRTHSSVFESVVKVQDLNSFVNILETSHMVINYTVGNGMKQRAFGFGGYSKWVTSNYPEKKGNICILRMN